MKDKQHSFPSFFIISPAVDGNVYIVVDMELKGGIREALLKMMLAKGISGILSYTKEGIRLWLGLLKYLYS